MRKHILHRLASDAFSPVHLIGVMLAIACGLAGCGGAASEADKSADAGVMKAPPSASSSAAFSIDDLHKALRARNPQYTGKANVESRDGGMEPFFIDLSNAQITDLSPLKGLPLGLLRLDRNPVTDLSPLKDMPLQGLYLDDTSVSDLSPLAGSKTLLELALSRTKVSDLSALKGSPLKALYLEETPVTDLSPLAGSQLQVLHLSKTGVSNLTPIIDAPLQQLNLLGSRVADLRPCAAMPLKLLWLNSCPVSDLSPLASVHSLESLTLYNTLVTDLSPLANLRLRRLHIGNTQVTDLSPLAKMELERLIFHPGKITKGLDIVRNGMPAMRELGLEFHDTTAGDLMSPREFWRRFDAGEFRK